MYNDGRTTGTSSLVLTNCVLFGNGSSNTFSNTTSVSAIYSLFDNTVTGNLITTTSPFASTTSLALNACSPAIDAGDNSVTVPATDLAGNNRRICSLDMGAYEFQGTPASLASSRSAPVASASTSWSPWSSVVLTPPSSGTKATPYKELVSSLAGRQRREDRKSVV